MSSGRRCRTIVLRPGWVVVRVSGMPLFGRRGLLGGEGEQGAAQVDRVVPARPHAAVADRDRDAVLVDPDRPQDGSGVQQLPEQVGVEGSVPDELGELVGGAEGGAQRHQHLHLRAARHRRRQPAAAPLPAPTRARRGPAPGCAATARVAGEAGGGDGGGGAGRTGCRGR